MAALIINERWLEKKKKSIEVLTPRGRGVACLYPGKQTVDSDFQGNPSTWQYFGMWKIMTDKAMIMAAKGGIFHSVWMSLVRHWELKATLCNILTQTL